MKTHQNLRGLKLRLIESALEREGYVRDGNKVFALEDWAAVVRGGWRDAVDERPDRHRTRVVRAADLVARQYFDQ